MFCNNCGTEMSNSAQFCPNCGANCSRPVVSQMELPGQTGVASNDRTQSVLPESMKELVEKAVIGVAAAIVIVLALMWVFKLFEKLEGVVRVFGAIDGIASPVGTLVFVLCAVIPILCGVAAAVPLIRGLVENSYRSNNIERSIVACVLFAIVCVAFYICKLVFGGSSSGDFGLIAFTIVTTFGQTAVDSLIPIIISGVLLVIVRARLVQAR